MDADTLRDRQVKEESALNWTEADRDRFRQKFRHDGPTPDHRPELGPCWEWTATKTPEGYGGLTWRQTKMLAHRVSAVLAGMDLSGGKVVDHLCWNPSCVNPDHLEPVTNKENLLRGRGITAVRARQTHCVNGHPLSGGNLYTHKSGRYCRKCRDVAVKDYRKRIGRVTQQCEGINTKNGKRCQRRTANDSGMCHSHEEQSRVVEIVEVEK